MPPAPGGDPEPHPGSLFGAPREVAGGESASDVPRSSWGIRETGPAPAGQAQPASPRYTPDGRWFWTGSCWIGADDVLRPPPAPVRPPPPAPVRRSRWPLVATALAVVLIAAVTFGVFARRPAGQPAPAPPANRVFNLPLQHHVSSVGIRGTVTTQGIVESVTGVLDLTPDRALHVVLHVGNAYVGEYLDTGGIDYQTQEPGGPWNESTPVSFIDDALGWTGGPPPPGLQVVGQQALAGEPAWHLQSSSGAGWWIGAHTGHPLRFVDRTAEWAIDLTFWPLAHQSALMVPPESNVSTLPVQGAVRTIVSAPQMSVEVNSVQPAPPVLGSPPAGFRYEALNLSYENDGQEPDTFDNAFTLTGDHGAQYVQSDNVELAPILPRGLVLQPGQLVSGWDVFVVSRGARDLTLRVGPQQDEGNLDFLVSIPLS